MKERIVKMFYLGLKKMRDPYYQGIAAQVAFFFILSIMPTTMLVTQLLGLFNVSLDSLKEMLLESESTSQLMNFLTSNFSFESQASTNIVLIVMAVWAASRIQFTLMRVSNYTFTDGKDAGSYWKDRFRAMILVIVTILVLVAVIVVVVYGEIIFKYLASILTVSDKVDFIWTVLRWPIAAGIYFLTISFTYYVLPYSRLSFRDIMPGSLFCAIGMLVVTMFYSGYTSRAVNNNLIYGSMASIAVLMFWFYAISWVLIIGILFNKVWDDTRPKKKLDK